MQLQLPLETTTLQILKERVHESLHIPRRQQRLFFMGRELKTPGRTLAQMGIGNFRNFIIHVHCTKPIPKSTTVAKSTHQLPTARRSAQTNRNSNAPPAPQQQQEIIDLDDDDDDDDVQVVVPPTNNRSSKQEVVELLDDDSDDDDDDIAVVEAPASKRRRRKT